MQNNSSRYGSMREGFKGRKAVVAVLIFLPCMFFHPVLFGREAATGNILLHTGWEFRKTGDQVWMPATVPGTVHTDLLANGKIPDPFFGDNEKSLQWIDTCSWEYRNQFEVDSMDLKHTHCDLTFEGLDTYAKVFLNEELVLDANNMFRTWTVDVKKKLKPGKNVLLIRFKPAAMVGKAEAKKIPYTLPGDEKVFTRKAQYQYGWDWGPRFVGCGIWKPVLLSFRSSFHISNIHLITEQLSDTFAVVAATLSVMTDEPAAIDFSWSTLEEGVKPVKDVKQLNKGENHIRLRCEIKNPKRWWCNGTGDAMRYHFAISARDSLHEVKREISYGLRKVELVQEKDTKGNSFYFRLNGVPVFMKGANWIPGDHFLPRMTNEKYRKLLLGAKEANMNMIRVWGGGVYEDDYFYELCDSLGLMVWQDFMFACAMYPGDLSFIENVKAEVRDQVLRLRNHASIALWCGNNEIDEGWKNWGWQKQYGYTVKDSAEIWNNYLKLFHQAIPRMLTQLDPARPYWESSPSIGWGREESMHRGDSHYWGVWWGNEPFEKYISKTGRFMSEYGFQGMPSLRAIESFTSAADRSLESAAVRNHQKHPTGFETIGHYRSDWYQKPKDFESHVYVSQLLQAEGMRMAMEAHRRAKPFCMGSLYWQLNDCWPVTSWSSIDYTGEWKALHYAARDCFEKYLVSVCDTGGLFQVFVTSDDTVAIAATMSLTAEDFSGKVSWSKTVASEISNEHSTVVYSELVGSSRVDLQACKLEYSIVSPK